MSGGTLTAVILAVIATFLVALVFVVQMFYTHRYISNESIRRKLEWLLGAFPVATFCSLIGVCVPRALPYMDSFVLLYVSQALFTYIQLLRNLFGSHNR